MLRYASAARWQDSIRENQPRPSRLDPYQPYLERRFTEGCTSVTRLHSELTVEQLLSPTAWAVRQVTGWISRHPVTVPEEDHVGLKEVLARCPESDGAG
ncbi:hypothetical protein [Streptomyces sp. NPDC016675]|uniref:hypothetical protein n=1 Tax=Streptomyces sp. NPDC016675 TaxID=3364970 RepID=UPI0036FE47EE